MNKIITFLIFGYFLIISNYSFCQWQQTSLTQGTINCIDTTQKAIYAGTTIGLFYSFDNFDSWHHNTSWWRQYQSTDNVKSILFKGQNIMFFLDDGEEIYSNNYGASWSYPDGIWFNSYQNPVYYFASLGNKIFSGTPKGVYISNDYGISWGEVDNGFQYTPIISSLVTSSSNICVGTNVGIYYSDNNGGSWNPGDGIGHEGHNATALASIKNFVFAGTSGLGMFLSTNNGESWTAMSNSPSTVTSIAIRGSNIFAASGYSGVYLSTDLGKTWNPVNTGFPKSGGNYCFINTIAIKGSIVFAGTNGVGIWKRNLSEMTGINELEVDNRDLYINICPNPINQTSAISYDLSEKGHATLIVYDITGREIVILMDEVKNKGEYSLRFNSENLKSGVYFIKFLTSNGAGTTKFIKL